MRSRLLVVLVHVLCSGAFLALPYVFAPHGFASIGMVAHHSHERAKFLTYLLMLGLFYLNFYVLIPRLYFPRRYLAYVLALVGSFGLVVLGMVVLDRRELLRAEAYQRGTPPWQVPHGPPPASRPPGGAPGGRPFSKPPFGFELSQNLFLFLVGVFVSLALRINLRLRQTEQEKTQAELSWLRAQINPHFLFNTLNSIYALAIEGSGRTAEAVVTLSAMMRYVLQDARSERVPLSSELAYLDHYVQLQRLRLDDTVVVTYGVTGPPNGLTIAPLLLISFVENAFKYGVNPDRPSPITIRLTIEGGTLALHVFNLKARTSETTDESTGIGLVNTRARLQLLYPGRHALRVRDEPDQFTVDVTLTLV
jgi:hypothetical protein